MLEKMATYRKITHYKALEITKARDGVGQRAIESKVIVEQNMQRVTRILLNIGIAIEKVVAITKLPDYLVQKLACWC